MSDDFFSNVPARRPARHPSPDTDTDTDTDTNTNTDHNVHHNFAHAINIRFGSADIRTARLLPGDLPQIHQHTTPLPRPLSPSQHSPLPPIISSQQPFSAVPPAALRPYLADSRTLILDIRPHAAHATARILRSLSLSVPTTLLKRPLFSLSKLSQMLPSPSSRVRFANWSSASCILVYDSDSTFPPDNSVIAGFLRKFHAEGFSGELGWVRGGFQAVWREARHLTTTEPLTPEEDDPDPASSSGTLRTTHLPKAAFSVFSTTAAPPPHPGAIPVSNTIPNTPAPSASRAANPFFDTIRQNIELSHGITERIPLRLPRRVRRRIHDLPSIWLQDIARRSALTHSFAPRPGLDNLESGSESSDDPHTSDPDENDPNVEEGTEALAMQFYRIELAEQRRLCSIMEHHTRESELASFVSPIKPRTPLDKVGASNGPDHGQGLMNTQTGAKSVPATPHPTAFPFSITAGVEKGTKNRYTHIWPFEHARVRLYDGRHQGSHLGKRDKGKAPDRGRSIRDRSGGKDKERGEEGQRQEQEQDKHCRSRSSPAFGKYPDREMTEVASTSSKYSFCFETRPSAAGISVGFGPGLDHPTLSPGPSVPRVKIEYDITEQDSWISGPPTPATALPLPLPTSPFYTPMETPMRARPPQLLSPRISVSPGGWLGGTQFPLSTSSLPSPGSLSSFPLRLPNLSGGLLPSIGEQSRSSQSPSSPTPPIGPFSSNAGINGEMAHDRGAKRDPRMELLPVDDYVNASYVQPLGTRKRYIATQGPLPSTYVDFWTLVWEQNVHVIVMLTREVENAVVKCGSYWTDTEYGLLRLKLLSTSPPMSPSVSLSSMDISQQGFFAIREPKGNATGATRDQPTLITRTFALSHMSYPGVPPRKITHLQYLDWSDMNVPEDPRGVLDLIQKVEQVITDSTPGPSRSGSLSPGSGSGSLSDSQSPDACFDQKGYDTLLSPTSAGVMRGRKRRRENEWRHPELDLKTGIATFALGKAAPVLLHCSAGVGRTGGFIAVDAVLDGIRRELRKNREEQRLKKLWTVSAVGKAGRNDVEANGEFCVESTETGVITTGSHAEESISDESGCMDVDELTVQKAEKTLDPLQMINTVPIHVSTGDRMKTRRRQYLSKGPSEKQCSSSESLVVHVPCAGADDMIEGTNVAGIDLGDPREAGRQSSSTREWVEQVSDQTLAHTEEGDLPPPPSLPSSSRDRSPESASNCSGPSALNSVDDSMNGSASTNASGSASVSGKGSENKMKRKNHTDSTTRSGTGSWGPAPSSVSNLGSGSISHSNSGTGTGSRFSSSLLRTHLRESSVTSMSTESTDSLTLEHELKLNVPLHDPLAIHTRSSSDMEIDCPPHPVSVPLQLAFPGTTGPQHMAHSYYAKSMLGSSAAGFSSPIHPAAAVERGISICLGGKAAEGSTSQPSPNLGSDELPGSPQVLGSAGRADEVGGGKNNQVLSDESKALVVPTKSGSNLRLNTELGCLKLYSNGPAKNPPLPSREAKGRERTTVPLVPHVPEDSTPQQFSAATRVCDASEHDQHLVDHLIVDYKLPRELHSDLSPPLISSFAEPICTVIQDMREQRMSLCQSLRQYVFVHAAVIEGALRIVDDERELWGYSGTSDDASSAEGGAGANVRRGGRRSGCGESKAWFGGTDETEMAVATSVREHDDVLSRSHPLHTIVPSLDGNTGGGQASFAPTSSSPSAVSSPSKGKRGPSPTELLREDRTGALSLNKRPSIHRKTASNEVDQFSFESDKSSPMAGENGGGLRDTAMGMNPSRSTSGRSAVPETPHLVARGSDRAIF